MFLLEFDILLIQEVDIKEPREEQVQTTDRIKHRKGKKVSKIRRIAQKQMFVLRVWIGCKCTWTDQVRAGG